MKLKLIIIGITLIFGQNIFAKCDGNLELWVDYMTEEYSSMERKYNYALKKRNEAIEGYNDKSLSDYSICKLINESIYRLEDDFIEISQEFNGSYKNAFVCTKNTTIIKVLMKTFSKAGRLKKSAKRLLKLSEDNYEEICE